MRLLLAFLFSAAPGLHAAGGGWTWLPASIREISTGASAFSAGSPVIVRNTLGPADSAAIMEFEVALHMRNLAELQRRLGRGERVAPEEMAGRYWPLEADYESVAAWLTLQGFTITMRDPNRLAIFASGPVAQISQAFQVGFARVSFGSAEYTSAVSAPGVPASLAPVILGINGLQPHLRLHRHSRFLQIQPVPAVSNSPPFSPGQIAHAYDAGGLSGNGAGQKIGIVIDTFPATSDLTSFWSACGVPQSPGNIEFVQVVSGTLPAPSGEETLDVEWSSAIASGAGVRVYATKDLSFTHIDQAYQRILSDLPGQPGLRQVSLSYGEGETYVSASQVATDDQYFAALANAGVTVFVSSGDGGSSPGPGGHDHTGPVQAETPASDPHVTAVGGTSLYLDATSGSVTSETAWFDGGGGASIYFARPAWQAGTSLPAGSKRLVPDVAAVADPNTGGFMVLNGKDYMVGGTSWSAPTWAGFCALINQARAAVSMPSLGLLGPQIYPLIGSDNFRDIVSGSNGPDGVYDAGAGYDLCTGAGVPSMAALLPALAPPLSDTPAMSGGALALFALLLFFVAAAFLIRQKKS